MTKPKDRFRNPERWFAWRPVTLLDGERAWLRYVTRHGDYTGVRLVGFGGSRPEIAWVYT